MIDSKTIKLSFTGDLMCELPLLRERKHLDFSNIALPIKTTYGSNYVVSNLETVFAGKEKGYTKDIYSFNSPDEFLEVVKESEIDFVSTANNHCLDRGILGLDRTIKKLDEMGIGHTGTFLTEKENPYTVVELNGLKLGLVGFTYGTNYAINKCKLAENEKYKINLLKSEDNGVVFREGLYNKFKDNFLRAETRVKLLKLLGQNYNSVRTDDIVEGSIDENYLAKLDKIIEDASWECDLIFVLLHCGGQFNLIPGDYTKYIVKRIHKNEKCVVVGNHPHVVQAFDSDRNHLTAYSLGNYLISPDSEYLLYDNNPELSVILHFYIDKEKIEKITFSIIEINVSGGRHRIFDTYGRYKNGELDEEMLAKIKSVYMNFMNKKEESNFEIKKEYLIW